MAKTLPSNAGGVGSIPGQDAEIPHASQPKKKNNNNINQKQCCTTFKKRLLKYALKKEKIFCTDLYGKRS